MTPHRPLFIVGLVMAASLLVLPLGSASATVITSPTGTVATPTIKAESEGLLTLERRNEGKAAEPSVTCRWNLAGTIGEHGEGKAAVIPLSSLSLSECQGVWIPSVLAAGQLEIDWTSGYNGTVTWSGGTFELKLASLFKCWYKAVKREGKSEWPLHLGAIAGGTPATITVEAEFTFHAGSFLCGNEASLTGYLEVTAPSSLYVDN